MGNSTNGAGRDAANGRAARHYSIDDLNPVCRRMLEAAGFIYDERIGAWLNLAAGRALAFDHVAERTPDWLAGWLARD